MQSHDVLKPQQSMQAMLAGQPTACWKLVPGKPLSLRPRSHGVLQIAQGQVWLTVDGSLADLPGTAADHLLSAGQRWTIAPGQHVVMEAYTPLGRADATVFCWDGRTAPAVVHSAGVAACGRECGLA